MRNTFACILLGSLFTIVTKAAEVNQEDIITLTPEPHAEGIPVSVNVIQTAQVVVLDKEQILSIAADINAQSAEIAETDINKEGEAEAESEGEGEENEIVSEEVSSEAEELIQQANNHLTTSWSVSGSTSFPHIIDTAFTFSPITLAPESSKPITKTSVPTQYPSTKPSVLAKKVKSDSSSFSTSAYMISIVALSIFVVGQYL